MLLILQIALGGAGATILTLLIIWAAVELAEWWKYRNFKIEDVMEPPKGKKAKEQENEESPDKTGCLG